MKLKSLSDAQLKDEILWSKVYSWIRAYETRYDGQPEEERKKEYEELHTIYRKYWDEAFRRGLVEKNSETLENPTTEQEAI